jgi:hypothetical protein
MQHKETDDYGMEAALAVSLLPYSWPFHFVTLNVQYTAGGGGAGTTFALRSSKSLLYVI